MENLITGEALTRCPLRTIQLAPPAAVQEMDRHVDRYYPAYQDGYLLVAGGIADQPARYLAMLEQIGQYERKAQAKYDDVKEQTADAPSTDEDA